jgi:hypothetical protein
MRAHAQHDRRCVCHTLVHSNGVIDREKGEHRRKQHELTAPARRACRMESCAKRRRKNSGDAQPVEKVALVHGCHAPRAVCGDARGTASLPCAALFKRATSGAYDEWDRGLSWRSTALLPSFATVADHSRFRPSDRLAGRPLAIAMRDLQERDRSNAGRLPVVPRRRLPDVGPYDRLRSDSADSADSGAPAVVAPLRWMEKQMR